jgi:hypothetical protein
MRSVRIAKAQAIERLRFSTEGEPGAVGAALLAEYSLNAGTGPLRDLVASQPAEKELSTR